MLVNIEGNVGQTSAASGWYQNGSPAQSHHKGSHKP